MGWMLDLYKVENNAQEKLKLLRGLCSSGQPWILSHLLDLTWDESIVRRQDYFTLITYMSWNRIGEPIVWDFVRNNWPRLVQRFTLNDRLMGRIGHCEKICHTTKTAGNGRLLCCISRG